MSGVFSTLVPGVVATVLAGLVCWSGSTILKLVTGAGERESDMHKQGWAVAAERDKEIVLLRGIVMRSFNREEAYKSGFACLLLILKLPVEKQAPELRKLRETLERSVSSRADGGV